jgi:hypothetical protein
MDVGQGSYDMARGCRGLHAPAGKRLSPGPAPKISQSVRSPVDAMQGRHIPRQAGTGGHLETEIVVMQAPQCCGGQLLQTG